MLHAGLDLSRNRLDVCLLSDEGEIVEEFKSPVDLDGLRGLVRRVDQHGEPVQAVIESMTGARFVHDALERAGDTGQWRARSRSVCLGVPTASCSRVCSTATAGSGPARIASRSAPSTPLARRSRASAQTSRSRAERCIVGPWTPAAWTGSESAALLPLRTTDESQVVLVERDLL